MCWLPLHVGSTWRFVSKACLIERGSQMLATMVANIKGSGQTFLAETH